MSTHTHTSTLTHANANSRTHARTHAHTRTHAHAHAHAHAHEGARAEAPAPAPAPAPAHAHAHARTRARARNTAGTIPIGLATASEATASISPDEPKSSSHRSHVRRTDINGAPGLELVRARCGQRASRPLGHTVLSNWCRILTGASRGLRRRRRRGAPGGRRSNHSPGRMQGPTAVPHFVAGPAQFRTGIRPRDAHRGFFEDLLQDVPCVAAGRGGGSRCDVAEDCRSLRAPTRQWSRPPSARR